MAVLDINLSLELSVFLFAALLGYFLATRIGQSVVIGEILIGILIGPAVLGLVSYHESIAIIGELGAIFLLFAIGLELKFYEVFDLKNGVIAICGVVVPVAMGYGLGALFGYTNIEALFIGTALAATSIAITAKVLKDLGKLNTKAAKAIIGAAVVDDVLSLILLSITIGLGESGITVGAVAGKVLLAAGFIAAAALLRPVVTRIIRAADSWGVRAGHGSVTLILAISIAFLYSAIAELIGLSAIVGAFLAGVTLESPDIKAYKEGAQYLEMVFAAVFFVSLGILFDFSDFHVASLVFIGALVAVGFISKIIGCFIPARLLGFSSRDSLIIGAGMIPRGEVAAIVGLFGLTHGILNQDLYGAILVMTLVTTIAVPLFFSFLYKNTQPA